MKGQVKSCLASWVLCPAVVAVRGRLVLLLLQEEAGAGDPKFLSPGLWVL